MIGASDEYRHRPTPEPLFNDSHYFDFYDPAARLGLFARIGVYPNLKTANAWLYVLSEEGVVAFRDESVPLEKCRDEGLSIEAADGRFDWERLEPMRRWRFRCRARAHHVRQGSHLLEPGKVSQLAVAQPEVELDVTFSALHAVFDYYFQAPEELAATHGHYEHGGVFTGTLSVGGMELCLDAVGARDHSWGPRDWTGAPWAWSSFQFDRDVSINCMRMPPAGDIGGFSTFAGYIWHDGEVHHLTQYLLESRMEPDGFTQRSFRYHLEDSCGKTMDIRGRPLVIAPLPFASEGRRSVFSRALSRFEWAGRIGCGFSEYLTSWEEGGSPR